MRRFLPALATLPLALWACDSGPPAVDPVPAAPAARLASAEARERGRQLFLSHCAICHGERGDGVGQRRNLSSRPQDFTDPAWRQRVSPAQVYQVIRDGRRRTAMAGWKIFGEDQIWDLVAYVLSIAESSG
jgi:mono/diheme cytochrome c family protein